MVHRTAVALAVAALVIAGGCSSGGSSGGPCAAASAFFSDVDAVEAQVAAGGQPSADEVSSLADSWASFSAAGGSDIPPNDVDAAVAAVTAADGASADDLDALVSSASELRTDLASTFPGCEL